MIGNSLCITYNCRSSWFEKSQRSFSFFIRSSAAFHNSHRYDCALRFAELYAINGIHGSNIMSQGSHAINKLDLNPKTKLYFTDVRSTILTLASNSKPFSQAVAALVAVAQSEPTFFTKHSETAFKDKDTTSYPGSESGGRFRYPNVLERYKVNLMFIAFWITKACQISFPKGAL